MAATSSGSSDRRGLRPAPDDAVLPVHSDSDGESSFFDPRQCLPPLPRIVRVPCECTPDDDPSDIALGSMESTLKRLGRTSKDASFLKLVHSGLHKKMSM